MALSKFRKQFYCSCDKLALKEFDELHPAQLRLFVERAIVKATIDFDFFNLVMFGGKSDEKD